MKKVFYWSPFISKVATIKAVINSAEAINKFSKKNKYSSTIIDAINEWSDYYKILKDKDIDVVHLNKGSILNLKKKDGFLISRLIYWYIFIRSFFSLNNLLKQEKPDYLIVHLITSLPLILFIINNYETKLVLRISGLPKMTFLRRQLWKLAYKKIFKITCPTRDTLNDLSKFEFLKEKLIVLNDPVLNIKDIQNSKKIDVNINQKIKEIVENKKFLLSIGRFTKQKNFLFFLKSIPEIIKSNKELYFLFIGIGEEKEKFLVTLNKLGVADKVYTLDYSNNVHYFMEKSEALISTSLWEDPGFVLIEAGYNNCQVVSSNCPNGPKEIIGENGGYLFESNSKESLIKTINNCLKDSSNERLTKKIYLKKKLKTFTSFYHVNELIREVLI
ncbi:glycosyltransferase [Candidatus Pelagibacter sp.]|nr:glycosyltransferase [Candidatus Pelagibacter sp.]